MPKPPTVVMRLPVEVVNQAKTFGALQTPAKTPGEMLALAWAEYKKKHGRGNG